MRTYQRSPEEQAALAKAEAGGLLTQEERRLALKATSRRLFDEIVDAMQKDRSDPERARDVRYTQGTADSLRTAVGILLGHITAVEAIHVEKREALAKRVAVLELALADQHEEAARRVASLERRTNSLEEINSLRGKPRVVRTAPTRIRA